MSSIPGFLGLKKGQISPMNETGILIEMRNFALGDDFGGHDGHDGHDTPNKRLSSVELEARRVS
jgi:hypothetical protein